MPKHANDNATSHVILEEDRAGNVRPVLAPLPEPQSERAAWDELRRAVAVGSARDQARALGALHASIFGAARGRRAA